MTVALEKIKQGQLIARENSGFPCRGRGRPLGRGPGAELRNEAGILGKSIPAQHGAPERGRMFSSFREHAEHLAVVPCRFWHRRAGAWDSAFLTRSRSAGLAKLLVPGPRPARSSVRGVERRPVAFSSTLLHFYTNVPFSLDSAMVTSFQWELTSLPPSLRSAQTWGKRWASLKAT